MFGSIFLMVPRISLMCCSHKCQSCNMGICPSACCRIRNVHGGGVDTYWPKDILDMSLWIKCFELQKKNFCSKNYFTKHIPYPRNDDSVPSSRNIRGCQLEKWYGSSRGIHTNPISYRIHVATMQAPNIVILQLAVWQKRFFLHVVKIICCNRFQIFKKTTVIHRPLVEKFV